MSVGWLPPPQNTAEANTLSTLQCRVTLLTKNRPDHLQRGNTVLPPRFLCRRRRRRRQGGIINAIAVVVEAKGLETGSNNPAKKEPHEAVIKSSTKSIRPEDVSVSSTEVEG